MTTLTSGQNSPAHTDSIISLTEPQEVNNIVSEYDRLLHRSVIEAINKHVAIDSDARRLRMAIHNRSKQDEDTASKISDIKSRLRACIDEITTKQLQLDDLLLTSDLDSEDRQKNREKEKSIELELAKSRIHQLYQEKRLKSLIMKQVYQTVHPMTRPSILWPVVYSQIAIEDPEAWAIREEDIDTTSLGGVSVSNTQEQSQASTISRTTNNARDAISIEDDEDDDDDDFMRDLDI